MEDIYSRKPINKSASLVSSQSKCEEYLTFKSDNIVKAIKALEAELLKHPYGSRERKKIGQKKQQLQVRLKSIRDDNGISGKSIQEANLMFFMAAAKLILPESKYNEIKVKAKEMLDDKTNPSQ